MALRPATQFNNQGWSASWCVSVSQYFDAASSILFLTLNVKVSGSCHQIAIGAIIFGIFGDLFALAGIGYILYWSLNSKRGCLRVAWASFVSNGFTWIVGAIIASKGRAFTGCLGLGYQLPLAYPALVTTVISCIYVDP